MLSWRLRRYPNPWNLWPPCQSLREALPQLKIRVVNVGDLMKLQPSTPNTRTAYLTHGIQRPLFTKDKPLCFASTATHG